MLNKLLFDRFARKFLDGVFWRVFLYISSFFLNLAIANFLGAEAGGEFYLLLTNLSLAVLFFSFGLETAISYYQSKGEVRTSLLYLISLVWGLIATGVIIVLYKLLSVPGIIEKNEYAAYCLFYVGANILSNCLGSIYFASSNNKAPNLILTGINVLMLIAVPGFILPIDFFTIDDFTRIYLTMSCLPAIVLSIMLFFKQNKPKPNTAKIYLSFKRVIPFAILSFCANFLLALLTRIDYWIVSLYASANELGNYMQSGKISQLIAFLPTMASISLLPLLSKQGLTDKKIGNKVIQLSRIYALVGFVFSLVVCVSGYWLFPWLYGQSYDKMYYVFLLSLPGYLAYAASFPYSTYLYSIKKIKINIAGLAFAIVMLVVLEVVFVPQYSIYAAALCLSVAFITYYLYLYFTSQQIFEAGALTTPNRKRETEAEQAESILEH